MATKWLITSMLIVCSVVVAVVRLHASTVHYVHFQGPNDKWVNYDYFATPLVTSADATTTGDHTTRFKLYDLNGGDLWDGDEVLLSAITHGGSGGEEYFVNLGDAVYWDFGGGTDEEWKIYTTCDCEITDGRVYIRSTYSGNYWTLNAGTEQVEITSAGTGALTQFEIVWD